MSETSAGEPQPEAIPLNIYSGLYSLLAENLEELEGFCTASTGLRITGENNYGRGLTNREKLV
jgi:hypothetical protein